MLYHKVSEIDKIQRVFKCKDIKMITKIKKGQKQKTNILQKH